MQRLGLRIARMFGLGPQGGCWALVLPILIASLFLAFNPDASNLVCNVGYCGSELAACVQDAECGEMLQCIQQCTNANSTARSESARRHAHLQHPTTMLPCIVGCFDLMNDFGENFMECSGTRCPRDNDVGASDTCAPLAAADVIPFASIPPDALRDVWHKPFTNSWDTWPCQTSTFYQPRASHPPPEAWMREWPTSDRVWRMDHEWSIFRNGTRRRHVAREEIFPSESWGLYGIDASPTPTFKTRLFMWGKFTEEEWYVVDAADDWSYVVVHVCARTDAHLDAISMVLTREATPPEALLATAARRAQEKLGPLHGKLVRIDDSQCRV